MLSPEYLRERLNYCSITGSLTWKFKKELTHYDRAWNKRYAGTKALTAKDSKGYSYGTIDGIRITAHKAAWAIETGEFPKLGIDHDNGQRQDNRFSNLKDVGHKLNNKNRGPHKNKKSGLPPGVIRIRGRKLKPFGAYLQIAGKQQLIGNFSDPMDAHTAYLKAAKDNGYSKRHGVI